MEANRLDNASANSAKGILIGGIGLGALLMYFLDPRLGRRRRALVGDQLTHAGRVFHGAPRAAGRDFVQRACGLWIESLHWLRSGNPADKELAGRVRARLGRFVSHPHAVTSAVQAGRVTLSGPILAHEAAPLVRGIRRVRGVREVEDRLVLHERAGKISALQGGRPRPGERPELLQDRWSPATRLLAGTAGSGLVAGGFLRGGLIGAVSALLGGALVLRAATNRGARSLLGVGDDGEGFEVLKTIHVAAAPQQVFRLWADFANFPRFMSRVREVEILDDVRSRWVVAGPSGLPVQWIAVVTKMVPNSLIEWRTEAGSPVRHRGEVRFEHNGNGGTRVRVQLRYYPPAGVLGHAAASLLAADPKSDMDEDLMRMKQAIETGRPPRDAAGRGISR